MKKSPLITALIFAAVAASAAPASAQCFRRSRLFTGARALPRVQCAGGAWSSSQYATSYSYATVCGGWASGQCLCAYSNTESPCEPCAPTTDAPRRAAEIFDRYYEACEPVQETIQPCEPVETTTPTPCEACVEYEPIKTESGALVFRSCPSGACPLAAGAKTAVAAVSSLLEKVNATRARYGLRALSADASLKGGAQYQASFCASRGALIHGTGVAEILAQNGQGIETALSQWLNSPAHRALLLNPAFNYAGVAVHRDGGGRVWCAVRFR